jgi:hypothetical protein
MTAALPRAIHRLRIFRLCPRQGLRKRVLTFRHRDQVNVIVHQAIAQDFRAVPGGMASEKAEVETSVRSRIKHILAIVPPLSDVVGNAGNHNPRATWHTSKVPDPQRFSQDFKCV